MKIFAELWRKTRQLERLNDELERRVRERTAELEESTAQLRETAERLRLASEAAGFGTYDYNATIGQLYWSPYLRGIVGIAADEPLTLERALAVVHPEHRDMVRQHVDGYAPQAGRRELEFKIVRPDGGKRATQAPDRSADTVDEKRVRHGRAYRRFGLTSDAVLI